MIMSLMRLLTAGKSWGGGKDTTVRYQMTDPRALPKFGSAKNPFRSTAKANAAPTAALPPAAPPVSAQEQDFEARTAPVRRSQESKATPALLPERSMHPTAVRAGTVRAPENTGTGPFWKGALGRLASRLRTRSNSNKRNPSAAPEDEAPV